MRNARLEEAQAGIKIARRNINNLGYADDTTLMAESEEEGSSYIPPNTVQPLQTSILDFLEIEFLLIFLQLGITTNFHYSGPNVYLIFF